LDVAFSDEGFNTLPEHWSYGRNSSGSMIHTCYSGAGGALMRGFAGFDVHGNRITVSPFLSDQLPNFSAHMETLYGTLALKVEKRDKERIIWVLMPQGCTGVFSADSEKLLHPGLNRFTSN